jgi:mono/diheme cytochrome c family protein
MVLSGDDPAVPLARGLTPSLESCAVRRPAVIAAALLVLGAVVFAGCGAQGTTSATPKTVIGTVASGPTFPATPAFKLKGDRTKGKSVFASAGCGNCHTLAAAHATGTVGPNLDSLKPDYRAVTAQVTNGGAQMPAFKDQLKTQQIADVAAYVVTSTGGTAP